MTIAELTDHLLTRLREVQQRLGSDATASPDTPFAEAVDSMGLVEFVGVIAADCGVKPEAVEQAVGRRFSTITALARAMHAGRIEPREQLRQATFAFAQEAKAPPAPAAWLTRWGVFQPNGIQTAEEIDQLLDRPHGWLEQHTGIQSRWFWRDEDPVERAATTARQCLENAAVRRGSLAALLVTGEATPRLVGLAADLHARLELPPRVPALEVGGACTGLLHCLYLGQRLARRGAPVLIVAVEAPSRWLTIAPGPEGETAALFGDAAGACLLSADEPGDGGFPLRDILLGCDGRAADLVRVEVSGPVAPVVRMDGPALAVRAVQQLSDAVGQVCERNGLKVADLAAVYIHAGNARMRPLVARQLGISDDRVVSTTAHSGNLGSVSLVAAHHHYRGNGRVVWAAVGAGLCWGAALFDAASNG